MIAYSHLLIRNVFTNNPDKLATQLVSPYRDTSFIKSYGLRFKKYGTTTIPWKSRGVYVEGLIIIN